jgi:hypothetical protein
MGIFDRLGNPLRRHGAQPHATDQPSRRRPGLWQRITDRFRRPAPPPTEPAGPPGIGGDYFRGPTGEIGGVRIIITGRFVSMSGGKTYAEWNGTIDTDRGNQPPSPINARRLADALTNQDPRAVIEAINIIITVDYAGRTPGSAGGFTFYGQDEGMRVLAIESLTITWR